MIYASADDKGVRMDERELLCLWKHDWAFAGGDWVLKGKLALTERTCLRCGLWQEISQDHVNHLRILERQIKNKWKPAKYPVASARGSDE